MIMKKKTLFFVALVLSIVILVMNIIVCSIYSLFKQENRIYLVGLIVLPLLPFILLLAIPNYNYKIKTDKKDENKEKQFGNDNR